MKKWVDPPQGWLYGFPKVWDSEKDGDVYQWMIKNGYPEPKASETEEYGITYRVWPADD